MKLCKPCGLYEFGPNDKVMIGYYKEFEVTEEDAGAFETWLADYDDRFDSIESTVAPNERVPWEPHDADDTIFGDDGMDEFGNSVDDYRQMGWMI